MANGIRTGDPRGFNKGRSSKYRVGSRVRQTPEEGRRTYRLKRCTNNNEDEDNSPKTLNDKKIQFSVLISVQVRPIPRCEVYDKSKNGQNRDPISHRISAKERYVTQENP